MNAKYKRFSATVLLCFFALQDMSAEPDKTALEARLERIATFNEEETRVEYHGLNQELHTTFRDFILQYPPMTPEEIESYRADFIEANLDLYIERELLRDSLIKRSRSGRESTAEVLDQDVGRARERVLSEVKAIRIQSDKP